MLQIFSKLPLCQNEVSRPSYKIRRKTRKYKPIISETGVFVIPISERKNTIEIKLSTLVTNELFRFFSNRL